MKNNIEIKNLCKNYSGFVLRNVTFAIPKGAVVGFIGENGAGKSTTINAILGEIQPDGGSIYVFGKPMEQLSREERAKIGAVFGEECLPKGLNLCMIGRGMGSFFPHWEQTTFEGYLRKFGLPADKKYKDLSKGMKQKAAAAIALSHGARVLVLDEATVGLDPVAREELLDILYEFMQNEENSVLISSHIVSDLEKICDYICFIHRGEIVFFEEKDELREKFGVLKCGKEALDAIDKSAVVGLARGEYGVTALVYKDKVPQGLSLEHAELEDIMLYFIRGEGHTL